MELQHKILYIWRLSNYPDLKGFGGLISEGRWHSKGQAIVYCTENADCALAEVQKHLHLPAFLIPSHYLILKVRVPGNVKIIDLAVQTLPADWRDSYHLTQPIGDKWLRSVATPVAKVPSALFAGFSNFLINPAHRMSDFIEIVEKITIKAYLKTHPA
jgi:RES domain-containing protein